jgi:hypothetical protein
MKTYTGTRHRDGCRVVVSEAGHPDRELDPALRCRRHSPTGLEWGYEGSGPAQLALALCLDALGDEDEALDIYQAFKRRVVSRLPHEGWTLTQEQVAAAVARIREDRGTSGPSR